jgi:hypothetical protein
LLNSIRIDKTPNFTHGGLGAVFLSGRDDAEHLVRLNPFGITTVVSLCEQRAFRRNPGTDSCFAADDNRLPTVKLHQANVSRRRVATVRRLPVQAGPGWE